VLANAAQDLAILSAER